MPDFAELAYGWPRLTAFFEMRTTRRYREGKPAELESVAYGLPIGSAQFRGSTWKNAHALPLRPIWSGLAINTLFYAALLWVGFCGPFALRRHVRRKCGRCIRNVAGTGRPSSDDTATEAKQPTDRVARTRGRGDHPRGRPHPVDRVCPFA